MTPPAVTVVIPNYNDAKRLPVAVESCLRQTLPPCEIIIVDDGSTDHSVEVIRELAGRHPSIQLVRNEKNQGALPTINRGVFLAKGEFVYVAGSDDTVEPMLLEKCGFLLQQHPGAAYAFSEGKVWDEQADLVRENRSLWSDVPRHFSPDEFCTHVRRSPFTYHTVVARTARVKEEGGFDRGLKWGADFFLWRILALKWGCCIVPECLSTFTFRNDSFSGKGSKDWDKQSEVIGHMLDLVKSPPYRPILPGILACGFFTWPGKDFVRYVQEHPERWDPVTLLLLQQPLMHARAEARRYHEDGVRECQLKRSASPRGSQEAGS